MNPNRLLVAGPQVLSTTHLTALSLAHVNDSFQANAFE